MEITENELENLKISVKQRLSERRFLHTVSVEKCAQRLARLIIPDDLNSVRAAALLHDISKEMPTEQQLQLLENEDLTDEDLNSLEILHSFSAPAVIARDFPRFCNEKILSAVRAHTVGSDNMSLFDMIIFISDYAEETRSADACILVNRFLFDGIESLSKEARVERLVLSCLMAISKTREFLCERGKHINSRMDVCEKFLKKQILHQ